MKRRKGNKRGTPRDRTEDNDEAQGVVVDDEVSKLQPTSVALLIAAQRGLLQSKMRVRDDRIRSR